MSRKDILDPHLFARFAWRTADGLPEDPLTPTEAPEDAPAGEEHEPNPTLATELAAQIARVWETPRPRQAAAILRLFESLPWSRGAWTGMAEHRIEAVRFWRLVVRYGRRAGRRGRYLIGWMAVPLDVPEVVDLVVEAVERAEDDIVEMLERSGLVEGAARLHPELRGRLVHVIENGKAEARARAARWLARADRAGAPAVLRRALRMPWVRLRTSALTLLRTWEPTALTAEDVAWLLDDAVAHPFPWIGSDAALHARKAYEDALIEAVRVCRPPEGWRPLGVLADGPRRREELGAAFANAALAAGWPERVVAEVDRALADPMAFKRLGAIRAAGHLPPALARPRLLSGAAFPDHDLAGLARERWSELFEEMCPVSPVDGVLIELLDAPPSAALLARLTVVRGPSVEAAAAILRTAFAEAPAREALVLLLYAARDLTGGAVSVAFRDAERPKRGHEMDVPTVSGVATLLHRFGPPAFDGLMMLAEIEARVGVEYGWLDALAKLATGRALDVTQRRRLRDLAAAMITDPAWGGGRAVYAALAAVGAPAPVIERLWAIVLAPAAAEPGGDERARGEAHRALRALQASLEAPDVEARFVRETEAAIARGAWDRVTAFLDWRRDPMPDSMLAVAERVLAAAEHDPGARGAARTCVRELLAAERLDDTWLVEALGHPESPFFTVAAAIARVDASPAVVAALERAIEERGHEGRPAAEAAEALVLTGAMNPGDPRLDGILERACTAARVELVSSLLHEGASLVSVRRHIAPLLLSRDEKVALEALTPIMNIPVLPGADDLLTSVLRGGPLEVVRARMERRLGKPGEEELYWRDDGDDEEDGA